MIVTVMSDASRCPETGISGYGYWIASDRGKKGGGGAFKSNRVDSIELAEIKAAVNAVFVAIRDGLLLSGDFLILQIDSMIAISALKRKKHHSENGQRAIDLFVDLTKGIRVSVRHVKAHTTRKGSRYKANGHCDQIAKNYMRALRDGK